MPRFLFKWDETSCHSLSNTNNLLTQKDILILQIDLDLPLEDQGPFDVILHKLTDQIAQAGLGDEKARQRVQRLQVTTLATVFLL